MITGPLTRRAQELTEQGAAFVTATVVRVEHPTSVKPGNVALVHEDGSMEGFVGGVCAQNSVRLYSLKAIERGEPLAASDLADEALALWYGPVLAGIAEQPGVRVDAAALEERRLEVLETRAEAKLALGRHIELISELRAGISINPERERAHELLMVALYRAGRQTEALEVYRAAHAHGTIQIRPHRLRRTRRPDSDRRGARSRSHRRDRGGEPASLGG